MSLRPKREYESEAEEKMDASCYETANFLRPPTVSSTTIKPPG